ncbi:Glutamine--fructose-6-phosphate aminotransferase [isomerizing] [Chlamydiales bacterium STE3]|nr:Glutamine--fructose-6-phosphate aminotransferase [isomerizing] [Chlamydiales bacterium STE3]
MCGIFGYIGSKNVVETVLAGLKKLEYRGYDSAGIAGVINHCVEYFKEVGKIAALEKTVEAHDWHLDVAIAQTRWATHGKVTQVNAHPHLDNQSTLAVVHNGIIENYESLKLELKKDGSLFLSETDTEVIAHLISHYYHGNLLEAVQKAIMRLQGAYSIALVHKDFPDCIIAVAHEAPLVIGIGKNEAFVSSDSHAFAFHTREVVYLSNGEIAIIQKDKLEIFNTQNHLIEKQPLFLEAASAESSKGTFEHYTLKEIHEQPQTIKNALLGRFVEEYGTALFEDLQFNETDLTSAERLLILGCGTSLHAGYIASYLIEEMAGIPVQVEISSEYRYKNPVVVPNTLVVAISQSGETADTIAAMRELKAKGAKILAICNVSNSTIARDADGCIFLKAGPEIGVCSTKAFTSQIIVLALLTLLLARMRHMHKQAGQQFIKSLQQLPEIVQIVLDKEAEIKKLAEKYAAYENFFFLGRNYMFPTSLEGALKLKEISYINANGYPAGEIKHGPIALINENCPTIALCSNKATFSKLLNNLMEIKARNGKILAVSEHEDEELRKVADDLFIIPATIDALATIPASVFTQLFAYYIAKKRGADIDQPRNLAKSVTVE